MANKLITVPTFTFRQGQFGDDVFEKPIQVSFYNGAISLTQEGDYDQDEEIILHPDFVNKLFKAIQKNMPEALEAL